MMYRVARTGQAIFYELTWTSKQNAGDVCVGAIQAQSIVVQRVAEELLAESDAKCESIERRLRRFLANKRVKVTEPWE